MKRQQQGVVLVITLLILLTLTLISSSAMQTALLEEKIAGNSRHHQQIFQQAEAALEAGENWLRKNDSLINIGDFFTAEQFRITLLHRHYEHAGAQSYADQNNSKNEYYLIENQQPGHGSGAQIALQSIYLKRN